MAIAITLKEYLADAGVSYELLKHSPTGDSRQTAEVAHIPGDLLVKAVLLEDDDGRYLLAIIPSDQHVDLAKLQQQYKIHLDLATEQEIVDVFDDCDVGAIPPVGEAYGIDVMMDNRLESCPDVYFEGGDHIHLVHLSGNDFKQLMKRAIHTDFAKV